MTLVKVIIGSQPIQQQHQQQKQQLQFFSTKKQGDKFGTSFGIFERDVREQKSVLHVLGVKKVLTIDTSKHERAKHIFLEQTQKTLKQKKI